VHEGIDVTVLQAITCLMAMKSKYSFSNNCYNDIVKLIIDLIPSNHNMSKDLYHCKKIVAALGMNYQKIDACEDNCMLFWKENEKTTHCIHCSKSRYVVVLDEDGNMVTTNVPIKQLRYMPITPRLKRLFLNQETVKQMMWHKEGDCQDQDSDIMVHPSDGEA
jgi:ABC-type bacteriocin/lantibiotic exporter with double-glycine peptidase domain